MPLFKNGLFYMLSDVQLRRNGLALLRFFGIVILIITLFGTVFFQAIMYLEGQSHSWITGIYWAVSTMSTSGFGDIVFTTDLGRAYSILVSLFGVILLVTVVPFTVLKLLYTPWLEARIQYKAPRDVPQDVYNHVLISHYDSVAIGVIDRLKTTNTPYYVIEPDPSKAARLLNDGISVVTGEIDSQAAYENWGVQRAQLLVANREDTTNTNITLTVRESSKEIPIVALVEDEDSVDILELSGASQALPLKSRLGEYLGNRARAGLGRPAVIGSFKDIQIAEFSARNTPLAGQTIRETHLRGRIGVNIVGIWDHGHLKPAFPQTLIKNNSIVVVAGSTIQITSLDDLLKPAPQTASSVLVVGAGIVGKAAARSLKNKGIAVHLIDRTNHPVEDLSKISDHVYIGNANDHDVLERAGLNDAAAVLLTTNDDAMNIYLTVYFRRLKSNLRIVSRITHDRNLDAIYRAGADFVLSYSTLGAESVVSFVEGHELVILGEGVDLFSMRVPKSLVGKTLAETGIGSRVGLSVVAVQKNDQLVSSLHASTLLNSSDELIMFGDVRQRSAFTKTFGQPPKKSSE